MMWFVIKTEKWLHDARAMMAAAVRGDGSGDADTGVVDTKEQI